MGDRNITVIRIPKERIGVLVGKNGEVKRAIEEKSGTFLTIDSEQGDVIIGENPEDALLSLRTTEVVRAIGRGFNPEKAMKLFNENYELIVISLRDIAKKGSNRINEIKGRIIGREGKTRRIIEEITETDVCIYGDTVGVIGDFISIRYSLQALQMLIGGKKHRTVYSFLESKAKELREQKFAAEFGD
ncbi:KH domain-containing protein [Caldiplasma sukawensis]